MYKSAAPISAIHYANADAAVASLTFHSALGGGGEIHFTRERLRPSCGSHDLNSDFVYTRHLARAQYLYGTRKQIVCLFLAGTIAGNAPLFERLTG